MEAGADFEQRAHAPARARAPARRLGDPREDLEQRALPGAVASDHAERLRPRRRRRSTSRSAQSSCVGAASPPSPRVERLAQASVAAQVLPEPVALAQSPHLDRGAGHQITSANAALDAREVDKAGDEDDRHDAAETSASGPGAGPSGDRPAEARRRRRPSGSGRTRTATRPRRASSSRRRAGEEPELEEERQRETHVAVADVERRRARRPTRERRRAARRGSRAAVRQEPGSASRRRRPCRPRRTTKRDREIDEAR